MNVLTKEMLVQMLTLQDQVNSKIDPEWKKTKNPFLRAVYMEAAEAIEHHGWKWWKKQTPNLPAVQMELVDIWHFLLSEIMIHNENTNYDVLAVDAISTGVFEINTERNSLSVLYYLEKMMRAALDNRLQGTLQSLTDLVKSTGFSWDEMYKWYIGKNMLNGFRQDNGYKEGTYIKIWSDGREDNDHLTDLLNSFTDIDPETFYESLKKEFQYLYSNLAKA